MVFVAWMVVIPGCGKPDPAHKHKLPDQVADFSQLFAQRCSGCHGAEGKRGPAPPLNDPLFLAITPDSQLAKVIAEGRPGSLMLPFSQAKGGPLTPTQIARLVEGIRAWGAYDPNRAAVWSSPAPAGNKDRGARLFAGVCAECHGKDGQGATKEGRAGAVNDAAFLALLSEEGLRRTIITGRPDLERHGPKGTITMPDYRGTLGETTNAQDLADLMALFAFWKRSQP